MATNLRSGEALQPRLYINDKGNFSHFKNAFPELNQQFNSIAVADVNNDGYVDVFFGAGIAYKTFGQSPKSYLFINQKDNTFKDATLDYFSTYELGMIRDVHFKDLNQDNQPELIIAGLFMPIEAL